MFLKDPFTLTSVVYLSQVDLQFHWSLNWRNAEGAEEVFSGSVLTPALCYSELILKIRELAMVAHKKPESTVLHKPCDPDIANQIESGGTEPFQA